MRLTNILNRSVCLCFPVFCIFTIGAPVSALASSDDERNAHAKQGCVRGEFKDYYLQGEGGDPPADYTGRVFKLSQDYPDKLPPKEDYPWMAIEFENGAPSDPKTYLAELLKYGLEGNVEVDFYVEDNKVRSWYSMPWMDWNSEVAADWPGTDGREFVHGLTHEFDSNPKTLSTLQTKSVDTWSGAYYNDRGAFGIGQVYCDPNSPDPSALNPDPAGLNNFADGSYIIKLLFSTIEEAQLPTMKDALEWQADIYVETEPAVRNQGPISRYERKVQSVRLLQIDVAVRDDRSFSGWLFGTFAYDGTRSGATVWDRMVPLGLQWGNSPKVTYSQTCDADGNCSQEKLTEQWIDEEALKELTTAPVTLDHLGYGGRLAGPVDNPQASCMGCHQTAGFPPVAILPEFSTLGPILGLDDSKTAGDHQDFRMTFYRNVSAGAVFSDSQLYSSDFSLQLSMSLNNFVSLRCSVDVADKPAICKTLTDWADAMRTYVNNVLTFGTPGPGGAPLAPRSE
ncbi:hypothetical protein [Hoeflea poritis]|uniref:Cytochrome c domain-containing protein n=1 Tax=Hoeflea poritis TaxID=2993659 RepID=A0ABT4VK17_9HYPH|nr:hypothetical protein [Hoeflea poritis]MDA4845052.1 hypothetical protein [Hoeflea poritis]